MEKPNLPKGTRDFGPAEMVRRQLLFDTIRTVFEKFAFEPLETPAMENLNVLTGKYGDEGDQLLFKILNSGDFLDGARIPQPGAYLDWLPRITEKGLRYDLTVPFARYVVMNRHALTFPFRRYQMQPVWRADRPQKGRYREFWQCDADVVGTDSLLCEAEGILMIKEVFSRLGIRDYTIRINHRNILTALAESVGAAANAHDLFTAIDKLEKAGEKKVMEELSAKGFNAPAVERIFGVLHAGGSNALKVERHKDWIARTQDGSKGLSDIQQILDLLRDCGADEDHVAFDMSLARGLSYYTGTILEARIEGVGVGSVLGGGRYDHLTESFGDKERLSGVGISFGVDRLYDALEELQKFPPSTHTGPKVLITHLDDACMRYALGVTSKMRAAGIPTEVYPEAAKLKKQLDYANRKTIPFVVVVGPDERTSGILTLKEMRTGNQEQLAVDVLVSKMVAA